MDLTPVQRVPEPTRDVLVTRDEAGEREFSGFGAAKNNEYADCFIDADLIPEPTIKVNMCYHSSAVQLCYVSRKLPAGSAWVCASLRQPCWPYWLLALSEASVPVHKLSNSMQARLHRLMPCNGRAVSQSRIQSFT